MNQREIKFRAWYPAGKVFLEGIADRCLINFNGDLIVYDQLNNPIKPREYKLCQYTGLKDKHGKEIYEGDIVKMLYTDWVDKERDSHNGIVVFRNGYFELDFGKSKWGGENDYGTLKEGDHGEKIIIGNIYETPNLLDK